MLGLSSVVWLSKPSQEIAQDFVAMPLLSGRSLMHEEVCPIFVQEYVEKWKQQQQQPEDALFQTFERFVQNCQLRTQIIEQRQLEQEPRPDVIPYPGIQDPTTR